MSKNCGPDNCSGRPLEGNQVWDEVRGVWNGFLSEEMEVELEKHE